jgi:predicted alpha/beta-hydrolase family hydrolase
MESGTRKKLRFLATQTAGEVSALLLMPDNARAMFVMAHGAGAGMHHAFMEALSEKLAALRIATLRYQFPYMEKGSRRPDSEALLTATVRSAVAAASEHGSGLPLFAAGKSMGGRMTSTAEAKQPLTNVRGLLFFGFPLHAAGKPSVERGAHLFNVGKPMLFLQGSRDSLADLKLLKPLCERLGRRAELFIIDGGDHSFHMLKRSGRSDEEVLAELAAKAASWAANNFRTE